MLLLRHAAHAQGEPAASAGAAARQPVMGWLAADGRANEERACQGEQRHVDCAEQLPPPAVGAAEVLPDHVRRLGRARHGKRHAAAAGERQRQRRLLEQLHGVARVPKCDKRHAGGGRARA